MKSQPALGRLGILMYSALNNSYFIRVYDENKLSMFKDYDLKVSDLCFEIADEDAYLYEDGDKLWIDYSPETRWISTDE